MTPVGQLLQRNQRHIPQDGQLLWLNPPRAYQPGVEVLDRSRFFYQDFADFRAAGGPSEQREFGVFPDAAQADHAILDLPKSKARLVMMIDCMAACLAGGGTLWLAGENRSGIRSARAVLESHFDRVRVADKARHCVLFEAAGALPGQCFDGGRYEQQWTLEIGTAMLQVHSMPGVFAHGRLDDGTALLAGELKHLPPAGRILDMACGSGILGALMKQFQPSAELVLADSDALALASARRTMAANGIEARVLATDGFSDLDGAFDLVISNPPFHEGFTTRTGHGINMLSEVRNFLRPGGQLLVVVNRHLPYRKWLDQAFDGHAVMAENSRFQVLQASLPGTCNRPAN